MSRTQNHHMETINGVGRCSVPTWCNGLPAGFCDKEAYGKPEFGETFRDYYGEVRRIDGRYSGFVPGLACPSHGGPRQRLHQGDPCGGCGVQHDDIAIGPCPGNKSIRVEKIGE